MLSCRIAAAHAGTDSRHLKLAWQTSHAITGTFSLRPEPLRIPNGSGLSWFFGPRAQSARASSDGGAISFEGRAADATRAEARSAATS
eukprot:869788-Pleurochrysis_carterae.AAC.1